MACGGCPARSSRTPTQICSFSRFVSAIRQRSLGYDVSGSRLHLAPLHDGQVLLALGNTHVEQADLISTLDEEGDVLTAAWIRQAAYLTGIASGALTAAIRYANERKQFGEPLRSFQSLAFRLADAHIRLEALRLLVYSVAKAFDAGERPALRARQALALGADVAVDVVSTSMRVCGTRSMTGELTLHRFYRLTRMEATRFKCAPVPIASTACAGRTARDTASSH